MKKFRNIATAILFIAFTFFFLIVTIIREKGEASFHENRRLAEKPVISADYLADGTSVKQLDSYFTDHFAGRSYWLSLKAAIESKIGESIVNDVFIGENMLLDVSERNYSSLENTAAVVNKYADKYDGTVYFVAAPSSAGVYGDMLPEHLNVNTEKENIDKLYSMFDANIRKIDSYNILKMLNDNYIYYRNDSKWTSYGAYCVYRTVIQKLGFLPVAYDKYTIEHVSSEFRGNLYNKSQYAEIKADMIDVYNYNEGAEIISCTGYIGSGEWKEKKLYEKSFSQTNDKYSVYLGAPASVVKIKTNVKNKKKLLVIKDDYADCFIPFLTQHYNEIAVVSVDCLNESMNSLINPNNYEQTLFLFGIENLVDNNFLEMIDNRCICNSD